MVRLVFPDDEAVPRAKKTLRPDEDNDRNGVPAPRSQALRRRLRTAFNRTYVSDDVARDHGRERITRTIEGVHNAIDQGVDVPGAHG